MVVFSVNVCVKRLIRRDLSCRLIEPNRSKARQVFAPNKHMPTHIGIIRCFTKARYTFGCWFQILTSIWAEPKSPKRKGRIIYLAILCDLFGMVKWPVKMVKWPPNRGSKGHESDHLVVTNPSSFTILGWDNAPQIFTTPLKINMEHNHGGLVQIIFLSKWVICSFQPLKIPGCIQRIQRLLRPTLGGLGWSWPQPTLWWMILSEGLRIGTPNITENPFPPPPKKDGRFVIPKWEEILHQLSDLVAYPR